MKTLQYIYIIIFERITYLIQRKILPSLPLHPQRGCSHSISLCFKFQMKHLSYYAFIFFLLGLSFSAKAQVIKLKTEKQRVHYTIDLVAEKMKLKETVESSANFIPNFTATLSAGEIIINYKLAPFKPNSNYYTVFFETKFWDKVGHQTDDSSVDFPTKKTRGDIGLLDKNPDVLKQITWTNPVYCLPSAKGTLEIILVVEHWGVEILPLGVQCNNPPDFSFKKQLPYYAGGIVALGGIVSGFILKDNALDKYEAHKFLDILTERTELYQTYETQLQRAEYVTYISLGLLAVDALLFLRRRRLHLKRKRIFDENCTKSSFQIYPEFKIDGDTNFAMQGNICMKFTF